MKKINSQNTITMYYNVIYNIMGYRVQVKFPLPKVAVYADISFFLPPPPPQDETS